VELVKHIPLDSALRSKHKSGSLMFIDIGESFLVAKGDQH